MGIGNLPGVGELKPVDRLERIDLAESRRASTPLETTRMTEGDDSVTIVERDFTLPQEEIGEMEEGGMSEASSVVFAPSRIHKRTRDVLSNSAASASATGDEGSMAAPEERPKKKKRGQPKATNIIVARTEREEKQWQEREEWEKRRMEDPNLVTPPAVNLPGLEEITEVSENQPTPDLTFELMQVVRTLEKVATTSRNLNSVYVRALRMAALKVHTGTNLLARRLHEQAGGNTDEALADLRRRNRALQLKKGRMEQEAEEAAQTRKELKKTRKELEDMRRKNKDLEQEMREIERYFTFNDIIYKQFHGTPMGSPLSPIVANLVMQNFEESILNTLDINIPIYHRYVDDIILVAPMKEIASIFNKFNSYNERLQFTVEYEVGRSISFLNLNIKIINNTIYIDWFHKSTFSGRLLSFLSNHPNCHKIGTIYNLVDRAVLLSHPMFHKKT